MFIFLLTKMVVHSYYKYEEKYNICLKNYETHLLFPVNHLRYI